MINFDDNTLWCPMCPTYHYHMFSFSNDELIGDASSLMKCIGMDMSG